MQRGLKHRSAGRYCRFSTKTKAAYQDRQALTCVVVFSDVQLALFLIKTGQDGQRPDYFRADMVWWYITLLTIGCMVG